MAATTDISPKFGSKIAHVQKRGNLLTLNDKAPINQRQIIVNKIESIGGGIAIHCPFDKVFLMNSVQDLVDVVDWDWMEENVMD